MNVILRHLSIIFYFVAFQFFDKHILIQLKFAIVVLLVILTSILTKRFSYKLLVNIGAGGFNEFLFSKNNLHCAESFIFNNKKEDQQNN